ncbi:hypothetical protein U9M48_001236 [Paspalum notatum var. saurae]|uniref:GRAS family transcription factor n=1 Tax=Paspalum notatum var. saurae TaxID=547442 RepID=A0AAQ3SF15_PASNO
MEVFNDLLQQGDSDENTLNLALSKDTDVVQAFMKGMEEANMLLPKDNFRSNELVNQMVTESINHCGVKKRYNKDHHLEEGVRRTRKTVMMIKEPELNLANEMIDEMMLHGYESCIRDMEKLRISMDNVVENKNRKSGSKAVRADEVDLRALLICCAEELAINNHVRARELLKRIKQHASAAGNATQRIAQCFSKGLEARLVGTESLLWQSLFMAERPSAVEFLKAYNIYFAACCFNKVAVMFTKMTIMQAMVGKNKLHIIDYGMHFGFQWADLLRLLANREGALPEVKITAIGRSKPMSWPAEKIDELGCRLSKCADEFGLPSFKFHAIMKEWEDVCIEDLNTDSNEVLIVSDLLNFSTLMDESMFFDIPSPRDIVLDNIKKMRPDIFIQSILNRSYGSSFLTPFREALFYYMALFDTLDATIPRDNESRLMVEQVVLGHAALNSIACEGVDLVQRPEKYRQWQTRNQRAGLRQLPLKSNIVAVLKDEVKKHHHNDFLICEEGKWLLQGWMGRVLFAHSTWQHASETGDATQRLAHCFTKGLEARLVGTGSLLWQSLIAEPPSAVEFIKAYNLYSAACCYHKVAIIFSKMTIMQSMVGKTRLHIVDYGMCFGFHWVGLLRMLASREGDLPEVTITAIGLPKQKSWPAEQIEETGYRLSKCANEFGLPSFKFHAIMTEWEDASIKDLNKYEDEVLVVNDFFNFSTLMDESIFFDLPSPRDTVLNNIKKMRADVFIQSVMNHSYGSSFLSRFREALFYNMALFDMLDATTPRQNKYRFVLEQWQARSQRAGLRQLPLKSSIVDRRKDEVKKHHHKDFLICKDGKWLLQGWMGRVLFAHSTWLAHFGATEN